MTDEQSSAAFVGDDPAAARPSVLPDRRELALVAVERTRMPMVITDPRQPDNPIVLANDAFLRLTGYEAAEVIGRNCRFLQGPDTAPADVDRIRRCLADDSGHCEIELLNYRKDGSSFWNQLAISPVRDAAGRLIYYFASQKDVTARRRAEALEATERLLLLEVDHRAMNALALVQSILRLTRADSVSAYTASALGRVDAIARAHRLLSASGWSDAKVTDLVRMEVPPALAERVEMTGSAPAVGPGIVQPLALVLHELIANAVAHGSLGDGGGMLRLALTEDAGALLIDWRERGGPAMSGDAVPGFGLILVRGVIERQLGGRLDLEWQADGLRLRMQVPARRNG